MKDFEFLLSFTVSNVVVMVVLDLGASYGLVESGGFEVTVALGTWWITPLSLDSLALALESIALASAGLAGK